MEANLGVVCLYKPPGITSHGAAQVLKRATGQKTGHTGTLDPQAEGVLPILIGSATRLAQYMSETDKAYDVEVIFGAETDTQDATGKVIKEGALTAGEEEFKNAVRSFLGEYNQVPPMYSALKQNGKKLYELARKGVEVERQPRLIHIYDIEIKSHELPYKALLSVHSSKGAYMRTLCEDLGRRLGACAHMGRLIRTSAGGFRLSDTVPLERGGDYSGLIIPPEEMPALKHLRKLYTRTERDIRAVNGSKLVFEDFTYKLDMREDENVFVYTSEGVLAGIYEPDGAGLKARTMLV